MSKITVTYKDETLDNTYTLENVESLEWGVALQQHINFLRGLGYIIPEYVDVV